MERTDVEEAFNPLSDNGCLIDAVSLPGKHSQLDLMSTSCIYPHTHSHSTLVRQWSDVLNEEHVSLALVPGMMHDPVQYDDRIH